LIAALVVTCLIVSVTHGPCLRVRTRAAAAPGSGLLLFVFDPWRSAILLVAGDKTGQWHKWYEEAIPQAEQLFALYLEERKAEEEGRD